jgi:hypothetical protein
VGAAIGMVGGYWYLRKRLHRDGGLTRFLGSLHDSIEHDHADFESGEYLHWGEHPDKH